MTAKKTFALIILDGLGHRDETSHNPTHSAKTPVLDGLLKNHPHLLIEASGEAVGLPAGQMGNSEVGHLHIGAGRKVPQDLTRIHQDIQNGSFFKNPVLINAIENAKIHNSAIHLIGLLSDGGVHSHIEHIQAMIQMIHDHGVFQQYLHAICDGRDTAPQSALPFVASIEAQYARQGSGQIASVIGRYYAMDRNKRWERTEKAYDLFTLGQADFTATSATQAVQQAYARGETDEFILPTVVKCGCEKKTISTIKTHTDTDTIIKNNDLIIFMNFRADRARQLTHAFLDPDFSGFTRKKILTLLEYVTLTDYLDNPRIHLAYPLLHLKNTLGEFLSTQGYTQLRLAETEKYAHVTYFLNGGIEPPYPNEHRQLIPSPHIATYDLQPEMSAIAVTDAFIAAIESGQYDLIVCNYANPDMVGHTGCEKAAEKAMEVIDQCLARVLAALKKVNGEALITADHGNIEQMFDEKTKQLHTAHTANPVPLIYVGRAVKHIEKTGALDDVAPTLLHWMGLEAPAEMTGRVLMR